jgi:hypothetical protein
MAQLTLRQLLQLNEKQIEQLLSFAPCGPVDANKITGLINDKLEIDESKTKIRFMQESSAKNFYPADIYKKEKKWGNKSLKLGHLFHINGTNGLLWNNKPIDAIIGTVRVNKSQTEWLLLTIQNRITKNSKHLSNAPSYKLIPKLKGTPIDKYAPLFDHVFLDIDLGSQSRLRHLLTPQHDSLLDRIRISRVI